MGKPLFDYLQMPVVWSEILDYLSKWKKEIPDLPEINFDLGPSVTFEEIKDLKPIVYRKLFTNEQIFNEIILTLFPTRKTLHLLHNYFAQQPSTIYQTLSQQLQEKIQ